MDEKAKVDINAALMKLDEKNDNQWTVEGLPNLNTIKFMNNGVAISRDQLEEAAPGFNRKVYTAYKENLAKNPPAPPTGGPDANSTDASGAANGDGAGAGSEDKSEQPKVAEGSTEREARLQEVAEKVRESQQAVDELLRIQEEVKAKLKEAHAVNDDNLTLQAKLTPRAKHDDDTIRRYLESQKDRMRQRGADRQMVRDSGVSLKDIAAKLSGSKLDESFKARRRKPL
jgi:hypothetical protein